MVRRKTEGNANAVIAATVPLVAPVAVGAGLLVAALALGGRGEEPRPVRPAGRKVVLHVKLAQAAQGRVQTYAGQAVEAMFTHLPADVGDEDPRRHWVRMSVDEGAAVEVLAELQRDPEVVKAFVEPKTELARDMSNPLAKPTVGTMGTMEPMMPVDLIAEPADPTAGAIVEQREQRDEGDSCPITTPSYEAYQGYLGPAPHGIDAPAAWIRGFRGQGVWFADIEGAWNAKHEDLPGDRIVHASGQQVPDRSWEAHGTAVLGEVVGRNNGKGVTGIAPDVERVFTSSLLREDGGIDVADAIDAAANQLRAGDVLLIELQSSGPRGRYIAVEYWDDVFDAIAAATKRGVVVIEAAGNGYEDLDNRAYEGAFDRRVRDSGAVVIGAGGPPRAGFKDREKLDFSNYGSRVDVQGWGRKVATLDYGDLQACDDAKREFVDRDYTGEFSGTSSASPIVAGAAVIIESIARQRGRLLPPTELRELLRRTGTPQAGDTSKNIGPRPDLARAMAELDRR